jgi:hypothetical protein
LLVASGRFALRSRSFAEGELSLEEYRERRYALEEERLRLNRRSTPKAKAPLHARAFRQRGREAPAGSDYSTWRVLDGR